MTMDYTTLSALRAHHPGWSLLCADHAPLIASFLDRVFLVPNVRVMAAADLEEALEDELYTLRQRFGAEAFPKTSLEYLNEWARPEKGWLRKFYRPGSEDLQFDLTSSAEKAIAWLDSLTERSFIGTGSRLATSFELLKRISEGSEPDPKKRLAELYQRRDAIDVEMAQVLAGEIPVLDETGLKDHFQQFSQLGRALLGDFREVEHHFRGLDRQARERIALWEGRKGDLLEALMGERDAIVHSDQGRSFQEFWGFLMSSRRQEEFSESLSQVLALPPIAALKPDARTRRLYDDLLAAGEHTQRMVAQLSQQLRRFLDDQTWLENRRIMELLQSIEIKCLALREAWPKGAFMEIEGMAAEIDLPMERRLYTPAIQPVIAAMALELGEPEGDTSVLYSQGVVDKVALARHIRQVLQGRPQVTLKELIDLQPLKQGLAELVAYLQLGSDTFKTVVEEGVLETIDWQSVPQEGPPLTKRARLPRVIFRR